MSFTVKSGATWPTRGAGPLAVAVRVMSWLDAALLGLSKYRTIPTIAMPTRTVAKMFRSAPRRGRGKGVRKAISGGGSGARPSGSGSTSSARSSGGASGLRRVLPKCALLCRLLSIAVQPSEEQVSIVGEHRRAEAQDEQARAARTAPAPDHTGVEVSPVDEPGHQRSGLFRIPAPVGAPGDISPESAENDGQRHRREAHHHGLVTDLIKNDCPGQPADGIAALEQVEDRGAESESERAVRQDRYGNMNGEQRIILEGRNEWLDVRGDRGGVGHHAQRYGQHKQSETAQPVLDLEVEVQYHGAPAKRQRELVHVGERSMPAGDGAKH